MAHRSSAHLPEAVESFRREAAAAGAEPEVVVVEQSEDEQERGRAAACLPERLIARRNRGYAAGVNAGVEAARGEVLLVGNPDLRFEAASVGRLLEALAAGWDIVGPQFFLGEFLFPPAEVQTPSEEVLRRLAWHSPRLRRRLLLRAIRRSRRVWESREVIALPNLSGALLAFRPGAFARAGSWDEGFFLYFEESDWLRRARRAGLRAALVPGARVCHAWGHAAEPTAFQEAFARSARWFWRKHFPSASLWLSRLPSGAPPAFEAFDPRRAASRGPDLLWLLSPSPLGFPAAGASLPGSPVAAVEAFLAASSHRPQVVLSAYDPAGERLLGSWRWPGCGAP